MQAPAVLTEEQRAFLLDYYIGHGAVSTEAFNRRFGAVPSEALLWDALRQAAGGQPAEPAAGAEVSTVVLHRELPARPSLSGLLDFARLEEEVLADYLRLQGLRCAAQYAVQSVSTTLQLAHGGRTQVAIGTAPECEVQLVNRAAYNQVACRLALLPDGRVSLVAHYSENGSARPGLDCAADNVDNSVYFNGCRCKLQQRVEFSGDAVLRVFGEWILVRALG